MDVEIEVEDLGEEWITLPTKKRKDIEELQNVEEKGKDNNFKCRREENGENEEVERSTTQLNRPLIPYEKYLLININNINKKVDK